MESDLDQWDRIAVAVSEPDDGTPGWRRLKAAVVRRQAERNGHTPSTVPPGANKPYVDKTVSDELATLAATPPGTRNSTLNNTALRGARLLPYEAGTREWLREQLIDACHRNRLVTDDGLRSVEATMDSAFRRAEDDGPATVPRPGGALPPNVTGVGELHGGDQGDDKPLFIDIAAALDGTGPQPPQPELLTRPDSRGLLYRGMSLWVGSQPGIWANDDQQIRLTAGQYWAQRCCGVNVVVAWGLSFVTTPAYTGT